MSQTRYLKSMITPTKVEPTENHQAGVASGVWSVQDQLEARRGSVWPDASVANPDSLIENNFSTFLYEGTGSSNTITNNIDLSGKGGLVWIKGRDQARENALIDTERGATYWHLSNGTNAQLTNAQTLNQFNSNGFRLGTDTDVNASGESFVSWTFKKASKFFDIVTYTGNGGNLTVDHNLGSVPGMIIIKCTSASKSWVVYHRGVNGGSSPEDYALFLNTTAAQNDNLYFQDTAPTSTQFFLGDSAANENGETHVAYIFGHETGSDSMIQCGSYTGNNTTGNSVDLGFEPQWLLIKNASYGDGNDQGWWIVDTMRGITTGGSEETLQANRNAAKDNYSRIDVTATGFSLTSGGELNRNSDTFIYVAIRRPNMATITDATKVFLPTAASSFNAFDVGFPTDLYMAAIRSGNASYHFLLADRLRGDTKYLLTSSTAAEQTDGGGIANFDLQNSFDQGLSSSSQIRYNWKRAKGYFDVVAYTGTGSARTVAHGLGAVPEMMWVKDRDSGNSWAVYYGDNTDMLVLDDNAATADDARFWNDTTPTDTVFTVGTENNTNASGNKFIAYLFATLAGVSKIGTVTHSGSSTDVDCGFSAGARFVLLKRTDATGDWFVWDSVRGIIAGNDPYLLLNDTAAEVTNTDLIDPLASGFQISGDFTDGDYLFYAVA